MFIPAKPRSGRFQEQRRFRCSAAALAIASAFLAAGCDRSPTGPGTPPLAGSQLLADVRIRIDPATGEITTLSPQLHAEGISAEVRDLGGYVHQEEIICSECYNTIPGTHTIVVKFRSVAASSQINNVTIQNLYCYQTAATCTSSATTSPNPVPTLLNNYPFDVIVTANVPNSGPFEIWFHLRGDVTLAPN